MIIATVRMSTCGEKRLELVQTLLAWVKVVRSQEGCIAHRLCQDLEDDAVLWLVGEWETQADLDSYLRSESYAVLQGTRSLLLHPYEIRLHAVSFTAGKEAVSAARHPAKLSPRR